MIHSLLVNRKHIIEVGMTEGSDEQDLLKALDNVADTAASVGGVPSSSTSTATLEAPAPEISGAVDSPFPPIIPGPGGQNFSSTPLSVPTPSPLPTINETSPAGMSAPAESYDIVTPPVLEKPVPTPVSEDLAVTPPVETIEASHSSEPRTETPEDSGPLASIKKDVLVELRPLVDKLNVSPEEKFDTLLLLIRSTDDSSLIEPAHEAAKGITDETRRAEALLEIVKEIDYLTRQQSEAA